MAQKYAIPLIYLTCFLFLLERPFSHPPASPSTNPSPAASITQTMHRSLLTRFSIIIPTILAIPFAELADRIGHSRILSIAIFGVFLEDLFPLIITWFDEVFPIRLIWLHFVFCFVGGGFTVVVTLLHVIVAQVIEEDNRTTVFFRIRAAGVSASVLGYAASGAIMKANVWLPWAIGLASLIVATVTASVIPITLAQKHDETEVPIDRVEDRGGYLRTKLKSTARALKRITKLFTGGKHIPMILLLVFLCQLGFDAVPLMLAIDISKRFGWSFSDASFLNSLEMFVELLTLIVLLPLLTSQLPSSFRAIRLFEKEKLVAQGSIAALALGMLCLGLAPAMSIAIIGIIVLALGSGQDSLLRSMATDLAPRSEISIVYSAITILRAVGSAASGPIYAGIYAAGIRNERLGLPFLVAAGFLIIALGLCLVITDTNAKRDRPILPEEEDVVEPLLG